MGSLRVGYDWATSLSCTGEGSGNPLWCSCLENPRDGGTWWATVYGVTQSRTRLKWLSSSIQTSVFTVCVCVCVCARARACTSRDISSYVKIINTITITQPPNCSISPKETPPGYPTIVTSYSQLSLWQKWTLLHCCNFIVLGRSYNGVWITQPFDSVLCP